MEPSSGTGSSPPALPYRDRSGAGQVLGAVLAQRLPTGAAATPDPAGLVLGLPRGGVVVAAAAATELRWELDVVCVRKLGVPWHPELAMGAIGPRGVRVLDHGLIARLGISPEQVEQVVRAEQSELERRERRYRGDRRPLRVTGRVVVVVDDGLATGSTARAACQTLRRLRPRRLVLAVPVGPDDTVRSLRQEADDVVCLAVPRRFVAVGQWYEDFAATTDEEVVALLGLT